MSAKSSSEPRRAAPAPATASAAPQADKPPGDNSSGMQLQTSVEVQLADPAACAERRPDELQFSNLFGCCVFLKK